MRAAVQQRLWPLRVAIPVLYRENPLPFSLHSAITMIMDNPQSQKLTPRTFPAARSLFRSLFMAGWDETYPTWQEAMRLGFRDWAFTRDKCETIIANLDILLAYPEDALRAWLPKICSGLPDGSPDPNLSTHEFISQVRDLVMPSMDEKEAALSKG